jgi:hypothetical protein
MKFKIGDKICGKNLDENKNIPIFEIIGFGEIGDIEDYLQSYYKLMGKWSGAAKEIRYWPVNTVDNLYKKINPKGHPHTKIFK